MGEVSQVLKKVELDEIELKLNLLKLDYPHLVEGKTYKEIANSLEDIFCIKVDEFDISLLHEPTIEEMEEDLRTWFSNAGFC